MNKVMKALTILILVTLALTACAKTATPAPTAVAETAAPTSAPTQAPAVERPAICGETVEGDTLTVMYQWSGAEEEKINAIFKPLADQCGLQIVAESTRDAAVLDTRVKSTPPDVLFWPSTAPVGIYTDQLKDLTSVGAVTDNYASYWLDLGSVDGKLMSLPVKADIKSIIWYSPKAFEAAGYSVPTTAEELNTLVEKMVADGNVPWSMGFGSDAATGWTGSDFIQDLILTQQGPQYVMDLISGEVAYNDAGVVSAYETYANWASDVKYTVGGSDGTLNTPFLEAIYKVFQPEPEAMMVKQSGFAGGEIVKQFPTLVYGTDYDFFAFPGIQGMQGGADYMMSFSDSAATKAMVAYLTGAEGAAAWAKAGFDLSPNKLATGQYEDVQLSKKADALAGATGFTPDLGDTIPAPFGETEWKALIQSVQTGEIASALDMVAEAQAQALGK